jgi:hypothetical protein
MAGQTENKINSLVMDSNRTKDINGYLTVENCVITGEDVAKYWGREIPDYNAYGLDQDAIYYVYRPKDEIKDSDFSNKPLLSQHMDFSASDYKTKFIAGTTGEIGLVGDQLKGTIVYWSEKSIDALENGLKYLSCGYTYTPKIQDGVHNGQKYDLIMTNIAANHVAMVDNPRYKLAVVADNAFNINSLIEGIKKMKFLKAFKKLVTDSESMSFDEGIETVKTIMANDELSAEEKEEAIEALKKKGTTDKVKDKDPEEDPEEDPKPKVKPEDEDPEEDPKPKKTMDADAVESIVAKRVAEELAKYNKKTTTFDHAITAYTKACGKIDKNVFDSADAVYDKILDNYKIKSAGKTLEQKQAMVEILPVVNRNNKMKTVFDNAISGTDSLVPDHFSKLFKDN